MSDTFIFWDLETVPDLRGFAAANDLVGNTDYDVREVLGNKFPKHIYHSIACIGALRVDVLERLDRDAWGLREVKSSTGQKDHYLDDIALQAFVLRGRAFRSRRSSLST